MGICFKSELGLCVGTYASPSCVHALFDKAVIVMPSLIVSLSTLCVWDECSSPNELELDDTRVRRPRLMSYLRRQLESIVVKRGAVFSDSDTVQWEVDIDIGISPPSGSALDGYQSLIDMCVVWIDKCVVWIGMCAV